MFIDRLFGTPRLCCPGCRAPFKDLLPDTRIANGSVAGAFLVAAARN